VRELSDVEVIAKPLDLDNFLEQVRRVLGGTQKSFVDARRAMDPGNPAPRPASHGPRVELVLYVSSASPASIQARRNLERILEQFVPSQVKLSVCDLGRDPLAGEADRVAFTPTLVKRYPEPKMWILGNLRDPEVVGDLLRVCGVDPIA
jgi:circadian clock protein KaiB